MARIDDKGRGTSAVGGSGGMGRASASGGGSRGGGAARVSTARTASAKARGVAAKKKAINKKGAEGPKNKKTVTAWHGEEVPRTKSAQKINAQLKKDRKQVSKKYQKIGSINGLSLTSPHVTAKGFRGMGPVASRQTKPPVKYGYK